jgi:hypothetical protein
MSIRQHPDCEPEECARCRQVSAELAAAAAGGTKLTAAEIGRRISPEKPLSERSVRLHLAHLAERGRLTQDRRTPLARVGASPASARGWAASRELPDRYCGVLLRVLGERGWSGSITNATWATAAGVSPRTVANHRPHLAPWVELTIGRSQDKAGRLVRQASTFRLIEMFQLSPVIRPIREGGDLFDQQAADLLERVEYLSSEDTGNPYLRSLVARPLREGMPFVSLLERLTANVPPLHRIKNGPAFLEARVPKSGARVAISAQLAVTMSRPAPAPVPVQGWPSAEPSLAKVICPNCERPFRPTRPGVLLCRECRHAVVA